MWTFLLCVLLGVLVDLPATAYCLFVSRQWGLRAALMSFSISFINSYVLREIIVVSFSFLNVLAFALGNALGTFLIVALAKTVPNLMGGTPL